MFVQLLKTASALTTNYRPTSVLPSFSKIFEKLVAQANRLSDQVLHINQQQYGFRSEHDTRMAVIEMVDKINEAN